MLLKKAQEIARSNSREVSRVEVFQPEGVDFKPFYDAEHKLKKHGYFLKDMIDNGPINFHRKGKLCGMIMADSTYKDGGVAVVYFK